MTENTQQDQTEAVEPDIADVNAEFPDVERPERIAEETWNVLDKRQQYIIVAQASEENRVKMAETTAFLNAATQGSLQLRPEDAKDLLLTSLVLYASEEAVVMAVSESAARLAPLMIEKRLAAMFGQIFGFGNDDQSESPVATQQD